jgi:hypothetical protein
LAATVAAGALAERVSRATQFSLRVASVSRNLAPAILVLPATAPVTEYAQSLAVSGWMDSEDVIHLVMEKPHRFSSPEIEFPNLLPGRGYRMRLMNATNLDVPVHLPGRRVQLTRLEQAPVAGIFTDAIRLTRYGVVELELTI